MRDYSRLERVSLPISEANRTPRIYLPWVSRATEVRSLDDIGVVQGRIGALCRLTDQSEFIGAHMYKIGSKAGPDESLDLGYVLKDKVAVYRIISIGNVLNSFLRHEFADDPLDFLRRMANVRYE